MQQALIWRWRLPGRALAGVVTGALLAQRGHLFPWAAVAFGAGIGLYFALPAEPTAEMLLAALAAGIFGLVLIRPLGPAFSPFALALTIAALGFGLATWRAHTVAAPVLDFRYYGPVEGRIIDIDRSASDALRLTLDRVVMAMDPDRTPARVRVSLMADQPWLDPVPSSVVVLTAHLTGPNGPVEPGDFDFRLNAWFAGLGAVGYTRSPVLTLHHAPEGTGEQWIARVRMMLSSGLRDLVPGDPGGLAAAVMTGDRSGLSNAANDSMRDSNLYHIVSISGMHMVMLVGFIFALVRGGVALVPPLALRVSAKKVAALVALPAAAFYLALAGRDVATERAFIMAAVMLGAVLLDRQALSLRGVAIAALIVLALRPEALMNPGFQMSFAAVIALVTAFGALRSLPQPSGYWRWLMPTLFLILSSLVAGMATAPFAAAHFNRVAHYGLIANLLAGPAMGMVVMPAAIFLGILAPLGVTEPMRSLVEWGCAWILAVSDRVAATGGAISAVPTPPLWFLPVMVLAALFVALWQGRGRWLGLIPLALAFGGWAMAERPLLLISATGGLAGVMTDEGRALSRPEGEAFAAENWLENDGTTRMQAEAAALFPLIDGLTARASVAGHELIILRGTRALAAIEGCDGADILIATVEVAGERPCLVLDPPRLAGTGALAGVETAEGLLLIPAEARAGDRLWTRAARRGGPMPEPILLRYGTSSSASAEAAGN